MQNIDTTALANAITLAVVSALDAALAPADTPKAKPAKARKAKASTKAKATVADAKVTHLVRKNQQAFKRVHPWAKGLSLNEIARLVEAGEAHLEAGWAIGEKRTAVALNAAPVERKAAKKGGKKGKKAKAQTRVVAEVKPDAPAKVQREVSENHVARTAPRRANGTIPPKAEWDLRERLADTGKFDRFEIDAIVAGELA